MADDRLRTKSELKRLFTNLKGKPITEEMMGILVDVLWRDKTNIRTSGFEFPKNFDSVISVLASTRTFTIAPFDPEVAGYEPRYGIFFWNNTAVYQRIYSALSIQFPNQEGLYCIYFDKEDDPGRSQILKILKNPTYAQLENIYTSKIIISFIYWDAENGDTVYFGDERHGSEWNPQVQWWAHGAFNAIWKTGLKATDVIIGDGSLNSHAKFGISEGEFFHEDMLHEINGVSSSTGIPVVWFSGGQNYPRINFNPGYAFLRNSFLYYNDLSSGTKTECTDGYFMLYHVFATNCVISPLISVMGIAQYANKNECCKAAKEEVDLLKKKIPHQNALPLVSFAFEINSGFSNTVKARIVQPCNGQSMIIWITEITNWFDILIQINIEESGVLTEMSVTGDGNEERKIKLVNDEETPGDLKFYGTGDAFESAKGFHPLYSKRVTQTGHGFAVKQAIRRSGGTYVLAQANNATNAQTAGIVVQVIDADHFRFQSEGFDSLNSWPEGEYFLSPLIAGLVDFEPASYNIGEVRQSLGWGTDRGLKVEIDVGDEIGEETGGGGLSTVITDMSVTGDGSKERPVRLVNDEEASDADSYYGTEGTGAKGFHPLPTEAVQLLTSATPTFNLDEGRGAVITLTGNTTITFAGLKANDTGHIQVTQDGTGGRTLSFTGASIEIALNSYKAPAEVKLTSVAGSKDIVVYWYTGTVMNLAVIFNVQP
jgi:hypothetical protein